MNFNKLVIFIITATIYGHFKINAFRGFFLQGTIDEESKKLLTINTHRGLFQFNRLAPGVKLAPGAIQRLVDAMIADIPGVRTFLDDAWPEVCATKTTTTNTTMKLLTQSFATFGVPETIVSDNGTQFTSHVFKTFCEKLGIRHVRTAPFHPQSNGLAERFVDTLKRTLRKNSFGRRDVGRSITSADLGEKSPAEVMFGRPIRPYSIIDVTTSQEYTIRSTAQIRRAERPFQQEARNSFKTVCSW